MQFPEVTSYLRYPKPESIRYPSRRHSLLWYPRTSHRRLQPLDGAVQDYFAAGLAEALHRAYRSAECRYTQFCSDFGLIPCPTNEILLCYFIACLGQQGLSHATIRTNLVGMQQLHIALGYPEPAVHAMSRLCQILRGMKVTQGSRGCPSPCQF